MTETTTQTEMLPPQQLRTENQNSNDHVTTKQKWWKMYGLVLLCCDIEARPVLYKLIWHLIWPPVTSEVHVLWDCTFHVGTELPPQATEFKYREVLFNSDGKMECETDRQFGGVSAVMWWEYQTIGVKRQPSWTAKHSIYQSIYAPALTCGFELWVVTQRMRSRLQTAEIRSLRRMARLSPRDGVTRSYTQRERSVEPLLRGIEPAEVVRSSDEHPSLWGGRSGKRGLFPDRRGGRRTGSMYVTLVTYGKPLHPDKKHNWWERSGITCLAWCNLHGPVLDNTYAI